MLPSKAKGAALAKYKTSVELSDEERASLERVARTRIAQAQTVARARILPLSDGGEGLHAIAEKVGLNPNSVKLCIGKHKEGGVERALSDDLACQRSADLGYAAELWTNALITAHVRKVAEGDGHPRLATVATGTVHGILADAQLRPQKVSYYRERRIRNVDQPTFEESLSRRSPSQEARSPVGGTVCP